MKSQEWTPGQCLGTIVWCAAKQLPHDNARSQQHELDRSIKVLVQPERGRTTENNFCTYLACSRSALPLVRSVCQHIISGMSPLAASRDQTAERGFHTFESSCDFAPPEPQPQHQHPSAVDRCLTWACLN